MRPLVCFGLTVLFGGLPVGVVNGHPSVTGDLRVVVAKERMHLELTVHTSDLTFAAELDSNRNGVIDPQEWRQHDQHVSERLLQCLSLRVGEHTVRPSVAGLVPSFNPNHLTLRAHYQTNVRDSALTISTRLSSILRFTHSLAVVCDRSGRRSSGTIGPNASIRFDQVRPTPSVSDTLVDKSPAPSSRSK